MVAIYEKRIVRERVYRWKEKRDQMPETTERGREMDHQNILYIRLICILGLRRVNISIYLLTDHDSSWHHLSSC